MGASRIEHDAAAPQPVGAGLDVALLDDDVRPHRPQALDVEIDGPGADRTAARKGDLGLTVSGDQRPEHQDRGPHGLHELVGREGGLEPAGIDLDPHPLVWQESSDIPLSYGVEKKMKLIESLIGAIQSTEIYYPEGAISIELEMFEYAYPETPAAQARGMVTYSAPEGMHDDCVIALALANLKWREAKARTQPVIFTGRSLGLYD